jgi:hypothetical protein
MLTNMFKPTSLYQFIRQICLFIPGDIRVGSSCQHVAQQLEIVKGFEKVRIETKYFIPVVSLEDCILDRLDSMRVAWQIGYQLPYQVGMLFRMKAQDLEEYFKDVDVGN